MHVFAVVADPVAMFSLLKIKNKNKNNKRKREREKARRSFLVHKDSIHTSPFCKRLVWESTCTELVLILY